MLRNFLKNQSGTSLIEYALVAALIAVVLVAALQGVGKALEGAFNKIDQDVSTTTE